MPLSLLFAVVAAACGWDWRERRIPNWLVLTALAAGLALQALAPSGAGLFDGGQPGGVGLGPAFLAVLAMTVTAMLLWRLRVFGAGDAKLLGAMAAFFGPGGVVELLLLTLLCGGVLALFGAAWFWGRAAVQPGAVGAMSSARLPYAFAVAAAALMLAAARHAGLGLW